MRSQQVCFISFSLCRFVPKDAETKNNLYFSPAANYRRVRRGPTYYFMNLKMRCYFQSRYKAAEIKRAARLRGEGEDRLRRVGMGGWGATITGLKKTCYPAPPHPPPPPSLPSLPPPLQTLNSPHKTFRGSRRLGSVRLEEREACRAARLTDKGQTGNTCKLLSGAADSRGGNRHSAAPHPQTPKRRH